MRTLVMKFGGASLSAPESFSRIADLVLSRVQDFERIVIVVSAMAKMTDELIELAKKVHPNPPRREHDMLVTVGERISMALLAMALALKGRDAVSFTGSQSGIITTDEHGEAKILEIRPKRILESLQAGKVVIVAGFQGVSQKGEITTLGRGGSDTTAVALGVALDAEKVEFYKDVPGIFNLDPKKHFDAFVFPKMDYDEALEIVRMGAKVLHERCLLLAKSNLLPLHVLSFQDSCFQGTVIQQDRLGETMKKIFEAG